MDINNPITTRQFVECVELDIPDKPAPDYFAKELYVKPMNKVRQIVAQTGRVIDVQLTNLSLVDMIVTPDKLPG